MSLVQSAPEIEIYAESDGKPMAETDVHLDCVIYIRLKAELARRKPAAG